jgi:hypothetical protein
MSAAQPWTAMMRRLPGLLVLVTALAIPAVGAHAEPPGPAATAHTAAKPKNCRTPFTESRTAQLIRVSGVGCPTGVKVAVTVAAEAPGGCVKSVDKKGRVTFVASCTRRGYRCTSRPIIGGKVLNVTCRRGAKTVRFQY